MARKKDVPVDSVTEKKYLSSPPSPFAESLSWKHDAMQYASILEKTYDEREVMGICRRMIEWVAEPRRTMMNYKIIQFLMSEGLSKHSSTTLRKNWPVYDRIYEFTLQKLGDNREWMAMVEGWDVKMAMIMMPHYDADWKEETVRMAKLKADQNIEEGFKILKYPVYIERDKDEELPKPSV